MGGDASAARSREDDTTFDTEPLHEERWDGQVWTEEELEEFLELENTSIVQVGKDFFDAEGNFLYRIWSPDLSGC